MLLYASSPPPAANQRPASHGSFLQAGEGLDVPCLPWLPLLLLLLVPTRPIAVFADRESWHLLWQWAVISSASLVPPDYRCSGASACDVLGTGTVSSYRITLLTERGRIFAE